MVTERTLQLLAELNAAIKAGQISNVRFNEIKDLISRDFDRSIDKNLLEVYRERFRVEGSFEFSYDLRDLYNTVPLYINQLPAFEKRVAKFAKTYAAAANPLPGQAIEQTRTFIAAWAPVNEAIAAVRPLIVKGRKPSANPKIRTYENTGTCPICGKNVKLENGLLVSHGYQVNHRQHVGNCFGVGRPPIEVSNKGLIDYIRVCEINSNEFLETIERMLREPKPPVYSRGAKTFVQPGEKGYEVLFQNKIAQLKYESESWKQTKNTYSARLAKWKPRPLPTNRPNSY